MRNDRFGIKLLDGLLASRVDESATVLILGDCGSGKSTLCKQFVYQGLLRDEKCLYISFDEHHDEIRSIMGKFDWEIQKFETEGYLNFLDFSQSSLTDINALNLKMTEAFTKMSHLKPVRVVIDSLTALFNANEKPNTMIDFIRALNRKIKSYGFLCFCTLNREGFDERIIALIKDVVDGVVELKVEDENNVLRSYLRISKMRGTDHSKRWIPYTISGKVGLMFFIPRIVIIGPSGSGKSTFFKYLSKTDSGLQKNDVQVRGMNVEILLGKTLDHDSMSQLVSQDISGILMVVDSSDPRCFVDAKKLWREVEIPGVPLVVVANKQDLPDAVTPENIREEAGLPADLPIVGTVATKGDGLEEAIRVLFKRIVKIPV